MEIPVISDTNNLDFHRQKIEQLYVQEGKPLIQVVEVLRQDGCVASRNMLLRKISLWGLKKTNRHEDMVQCLQHLKNGEKVFKIGAKYITKSQVLTYFRRKRYQTAKRAGENRIPEPLALPEHWSKLQNLLHTMQNFQTCYSQPFILPATDDHGIAMSHRQSLNKPSIAVLWVAFASGAEMLGKGQFTIGGAWLERGYRDMKYFIQNPSPLFMPIMIGSIINTSIKMTPTAVPEMTARYLYHLSLAVYGSQHLITVTTRALFEVWDQVDVLKSGMEICTDTLSLVLGKYDPITINAKTTYLAEMWSSDIDLIPQYEELILDAELAYPFRPGLAFNIQRNFCDYLIDRNERVRALAILKAMISQMDDINFEASMTVYMLFATNMMELVSANTNPGDILYEESYYEGIRLLEEGVKRARVCSGDGSHYHTSMKCELAEFKRKWGAPDQAMDDYVQIGELLEQFKLRQDD